LPLPKADKCGRQVCNAFLKENLVLIGLKNLPAAGKSS